eukprot:m.403289 g.403289  ORF g.403289 m.403289 type:complete len:553 (+) comp28407_c0_seq12:1520-3178(+)
MVTVDNHFAVKQKKTKGKMAAAATVHGSTILPGAAAPDKFELVYSKAADKQLWVPLLEKCYAKAHGSYRAISGGWICEGLSDLTAAPVETIRFGHCTFDAEVFWARLLSFHQHGFLMGASCPQSGQGLVGCHAYSVLDVRELSGVLIGRQTKIGDFFRGSKKSEPASTSAAASGMTADGVLRLIRLRNPWGRVEWVGEYSKKAEQWTPRLRQMLDQGTKDDGTFWISYDDFLARFMDLDVCKAHRDWFAITFECQLRKVAPDRLSVQVDDVVQCRVVEPTCMYLSITQPNKRGRTKGSYWFADISLLVLKTDTVGVTSVQVLRLCGARRNLHVEVLLDTPAAIYTFIPFSLNGTVDGVPLSQRPKDSPTFTLRIFSAKSVAVCRVPSATGSGGLASVCRLAIAAALSTWATSGLRRTIQPLAGTDGQCALIVYEGTGTIVAVAVNLTTTAALRIRLLLHSGSASSDRDTPWKFVPPRSRAIVAIAVGATYADEGGDDPSGAGEASSATVRDAAVDQLECELYPAEAAPPRQRLAHEHVLSVWPIRPTANVLP